VRDPAREQTIAMKVLKSASEKTFNLHSDRPILRSQTWRAKFLSFQRAAAGSSLEYRLLAAATHPVIPGWR
jgi:hypothetical protein